jgi:hypothetical protein
MSMADTYVNHSDKWFTPPEWQGWVSRTIGARYFDPCPENPTVDGLDMSIKWANGPTYVNHPGKGRGSAQAWWDRVNTYQPVIWCAFNIEQMRVLDPSPLNLPGWLVMPGRRLSFIWGGPEEFVNKKGETVFRKAGEPAKSPGNWTVFWTNVCPAPTPEECFELRTGESI